MSPPWGTAVAWYILEFGLGVKIAEPGATRLTWKPQRVAIDKLSGTVKTRHGFARLGWSSKGLHWDIPEGVRVDVVQRDEQARSLHGPSRQS